MSVKRYDSMGFVAELGRWVRWADYDALERKLDELATTHAAEFEQLDAKYRGAIDRLKGERDELQIKQLASNALMQNYLNRAEVSEASYVTLKKCYDGILDAGNKALAERDQLRAALVEAKGAIKRAIEAVRHCATLEDATLSGIERASDDAAKLRALADLADMQGL